MLQRGLAIGLIVTASLGAQISARFSQFPPNGTMTPTPSGKPPGSISGKVVNSVTGQGIKRAVVNVFGGSGFSYEATTDASGAYRIDNVEPGDGYVASGSCQGFEPSAGSRGLTKPLSVQSQQDVKDVVVQLSPHASVSGKVLDRDGDPVQNANVTALGYDYNGGGKMLRVYQSSNTDDRGQFRIADLQRGTYYIAVTVIGNNVPIDSPQQRVHSQMPHETYPEVFYPNVADPSQATPVQLKPGDDVAGIDFRIAKVPAFSIRGSVANQQTGQGRGGVQVQRAYTGTAVQQQRYIAVRVQPDGTFIVPDAEPGSYLISSGQPGGQNMPYGNVTVEVRDRDIDNVSIPVAPGFDINGVITIEGTPPTATPRINIGLRNVQNRGNAQTNAGADLTFSLKNVFSMPYLISVNGAMQGLYVKSIAPRQPGYQRWNGNARSRRAAADYAGHGYRPDRCDGANFEYLGHGTLGGVIFHALSGSGGPDADSTVSGER